MEGGLRGPVAAILAASLACSCASADEARAPPRAGTPADVVRGAANVKVVRVVDGDTIEVMLRGETVTIRLIGIDTPETVHPILGVECFGKAASAFTERSLEGRVVRLEFDAERLDRYERTLAYVWRDGMFNAELVRRGYATAYPYPPNTRYADLFASAERDALEHERGLWSHCPLG